ncbi:hypothetical protein ACTXT7_008555 [Hymenolepis weldensis]
MCGGHMIVPVSPKVLAIATLVQTANDGMKLHPTVKEYQIPNHIRVKPKLVFRHIQSGLVDDKSKQPEEIGLAKYVSLSNWPVIIPIKSGTVSLDEQFVNNAKRQLLVPQGEETVEEMLNSSQFRYRTTPHIGTQIWMRYHKHLHSR